MHGAPIYNTEQPEAGLSSISVIQGDGIFYLKDFAQYCANDRVCRRLRDLAENFRTARRSIVISGASMSLPAGLDCDAAPLQLGLPSAEELLVRVIRGTLAEMNRESKTPVSLRAADMMQIAKNLVGLTEDEATGRCGAACWRMERRMPR